MTGPIIAVSLFGNYFVNGKVLPIYFAYGGFMMVMSMSMLGAAYAIVKIIDATVTSNGVSSFYYGYRSQSTIGNLLGFFEMANALIMETWAIIVWILGWYVAYTMWLKFDELNADNNLTQLLGFKYCLLGFVSAAAIWITGIAVGDMASSTLGFFDAYDTKTEAVSIDDASR